MGDDGTMAKGTKYTGEFKAKAVRRLVESRSSYSSETNAIAAVESKRSAKDAMDEFIGMLDDHMVWYRDKRIKMEFGMSIMGQRRRLGLTA